MTCPRGVVSERSRRTARIRLACPSTRLAQVGHNESSKSAMKTLAPEFSALMTILRSGGPVISTRRSRGPAGSRATRHSAARRSHGFPPGSPAACRRRIRAAPLRAGQAGASRSLPKSVRELVHERDGFGRQHRTPFRRHAAVSPPRPACSAFSCSTRNYLKTRYLCAEHAGARSTSRVRVPARS